MNKFTKVCLILAFVLIGLGLILGFAAYSMGGYDGGMDFFIALDTAEVTNKTHTFTEEVRSVSITDISCDVRIFPSPDGSCGVVCPDSSGYTHKVTVTDGVLTVSLEDTRSWMNRLFSFPAQPMVVTVFLPHNQFETLRIQTTSGNISVNGELELENAELSSVSGDVECSYAAARKLDISTTSGNITLRGCAVTGELNLSSVSGDIKLDALDSGSASISTTSGNVKGSILTTKQFFTDTVSGEISLPASDPNAPVWSIDTTSGDIKLTLAS